MKNTCLTYLVLAPFVTNTQNADRSRLIARATPRMLKRSYKAPPGNALSPNTSLCQNHVPGGVHYDKKTVSIILPNGITRTAIYVGDQGCVTLPEGRNMLHCKPIPVPQYAP